MRPISFTPFPVIKTERLTLRALSVHDDKEIFALRSDKGVNKYLDREPAKTIEDALRFIHKINEYVQRNESLYWAITLADNDTFVGTIGLFNFSSENEQAEIGYELLPAFQGQGIMQEALSKVIAFGFEALGLKTIEADTHFENASSARLLEKFNFKKEATLRTNSEGRFIIFKLTL